MNESAPASCLYSYQSPLHIKDNGKVSNGQKIEKYFYVSTLKQNYVLKFSHVGQFCNSYLSRRADATRLINAKYKIIRSKLKDHLVCAKNRSVTCTRYLNKGHAWSPKTASKHTNVHPYF